MKRVVIRGAGLTGLAMAWYLHKAYGNSIEIVLVEKSKRAGGWIETIQKEGFLFERGPRSFRHDETTLALIKELGLEGELIESATSARFLLSRGKLERFSLPFLIRNGLIGALWRGRKVPPPTEDETIEAFFTKRLGKHLTGLVVDPLVKGIFGGAMGELSMRACFPKVFARGSLLKGHPRRLSLYSFKGGMETLTRTLAKKIQAKILYETEAFDGDLILSALPPEGYPRATLTTVNLGWRRPLLKKRGFGYLVPESEREKILGVTFDSQVFPVQGDRGQTRLCVMLREASDPLGIARDAISRHLGISAAPDVHDIHVAREAIPQFLFGSPPPSRSVGVNPAINFASSLPSRSLL